MPFSHKQNILLLYLIVLVPLGISSKLYTGPWHVVVSDKLAGSFYVIFWIILFAMILTRYNFNKIILMVTLITCLLEFSQLLKLDFLISIRATFIGRSLIGSSFSWTDFPFYFIGAGVAWLLLRTVKRRKIDTEL